ncbi:TPR domain protein [Aspergillus tanneri]|uniref:Uncharacterized protein n=1 Tax=Aspergillus tanneri TaxID=1220188 RepID=A0A5M9MB37_9EURO|nr:uncharacterized protein ATNIH1004_010678 [Aspergillus tanneri]KAA8641739.1 hypothetical protein ATNIH1004_010678 [Aspergillus tanneri]
MDRGDKASPTLLDHATYVGPVSVRTTTFRERGLFTMEIVKAGDILFCEKAFSPAFHDANEFRQGLAFLINAKTDAMTVGTQAELIK